MACKQNNLQCSSHYVAWIKNIWHWGTFYCLFGNLLSIFCIIIHSIHSRRLLQTLVRMVTVLIYWFLLGHFGFGETIYAILTACMSDKRALSEGGRPRACEQLGGSGEGDWHSTGCWLLGVSRLKIYEVEARTWLRIIFFNVLFFFFGISSVIKFKCGRILWVCVFYMRKEIVWWCYEILISSARFTAIHMVSSHKHYLINGTMEMCQQNST